MRDYEHSPARAGEIVLAKAVAARAKLNRINRKAIKETTTTEEKLALLLMNQQRTPAMNLLSDISAINNAADNLRQ